ncbi:hypothetical protein ATCC90586_009814 [Pythium insidiosum]|nr:hypothetical protein ATCC90586_009814 [Pythium insidiosum]
MNTAATPAVDAVTAAAVAAAVAAAAASAPASPSAVTPSVAVEAVAIAADAFEAPGAAPSARQADDDAVVAGPPTAVSLASPSRASSEAKKTGRPVHPLWAHFHRGDKRNRYHYHAFCAYCVERFGAEQVAPTRGVSIDMLRHLEKCANCPRHVVEQIKAECGRRDAVRFDRYALKRKQQASEGTPSPASQASTAGAVAMTCIAMSVAPGSAASTDATPPVAATNQADNVAHDPPTASLARTGGASRSPLTVAPQPASPSSALPHKRARVDLGASHAAMTLESAQGALPKRIVASLLKVAVASGLSPEIFEARDFHDVLKSALPQLHAVPRDAFSSWIDATTVHAAAHDMGLEQLRRVQQAQREATGKSGLSLSLNSWTTLDRQHIVAFTVVSPSGDMVCVRVIDMGAFHADPDPDDELDHVADVHHQHSVIVAASENSSNDSIRQQNSAGVAAISSSAMTSRRDDEESLLPYSPAQLARHIEDVLLQLEAQDILIASIVADSLVALNAARRVAMLGTQGRDGSLRAPRDALLVVPCFARMLSVLAGAVLTDRTFVDVVAEMIEITSYLFNDSIRAAVRDMQWRVRPSQDASVDALRFVQPNRDHWLSFVSCIASLLPCRDALVALCSGVAVPGPSTLRSMPHGLKVLVLGGGQSEAERSAAFGGGSFWSRLELLQRFLAPLAEAHRVFFQRSHLLPGPRSPHVKTQHVVDTEFAAARSLTLGDVMYQLGRLTQQYSALASELSPASASHQLSQTILQHLDVMWQRYEMPGMLLAYVLNHELDSTLLDMTKTPDVWSAIAQYVQVFYDRWFHPGEGWGRGHRGARGADASDAASGVSSADLQQSTRASQLTLPEIVGWLDAVRTRQPPFDTSSQDVLSFYASIAATHPQLAALGCRLFAVPVCTAPVPRVVQGVGVIPSATRSTRDPDEIELLLHVAFASSLRRVVTGSVHQGGEAFFSGPIESRVIDSEVWHALAEDWQAFIAHEVNMSEFHELSERVAQDDDVMTAMLAIKVPLQQLFVQLLPALNVSSRTHPAQRTLSASPGVDQGSKTMADVVGGTEGTGKVEVEVEMA